MKQCFLYLRVSSATQVDGFGFDRQECGFLFCHGANFSVEGGHGFHRVLRWFVFFLWGFLGLGRGALFCVLCLLQ